MLTKRLDLQNTEKHRACVVELLVLGHWGPYHSPNRHRVRLRGSGVHSEHSSWNRQPQPQLYLLSIFQFKGPNSYCQTQHGSVVLGLVLVSIRFRNERPLRKRDINNKLSSKLTTKFQVMIKWNDVSAFEWYGIVTYIFWTALTIG